MKNICIIGSMDVNRGVGHKGKVPWESDSELFHVEETTEGRTVVMGRTAYENMPAWDRPHVDRRFIVMSRDKSLVLPKAVVCNTVQEVLEETRAERTPLYIAGGATIFHMFEPYCNAAVITHVQAPFKADVYMPKFTGQWSRIFNSEKSFEEDGLKFIVGQYWRTTPPPMAEFLGDFHEPTQVPHFDCSRLPAA